MVLASIGLAAITAEKVEKVLDELVKQGKISTEEARKVASKIVEEGRKDFEEAKDDLSARYQEALKKASLVTREQFNELESRVSALEEKILASEAETDSD